VLRACCRMVLLMVMIPGFVIGARAPRDDAELLAVCQRTSRWARRAVRVLGLRARHRGQRVLTGSHRLIVANHTSWIDPLLLAARRPAVFVTSLEVEGDALLGRICAAAGCLFIDRKRTGGLRGTCARVSEVLSRLDVVVFPEATSTDGAQVLPFRPAAFAAAIAVGAPIQPLALSHRRVDDHWCRSPRARDRVCWYGDMAFLPHVAGLLPLRGTESDLTWLAPVVGSDRKVVAGQARSSIVRCLSKSCD
jgi:1-acyl-sn-glycerol-3-phosphate acyltransferase